MAVRSIIWGVLLLAYASIALADSITMTFSGTVTLTDNSVAEISEVRVGDTVSGTYSFDSDAVDEFPLDPSSGLYACDALSVSVNGYTYSSVDNNIFIGNDNDSKTALPVDAYEIVSPLNDVSGPDLSGLPIAQIDITLVDTTASVFSDDALPAMVSIADFDIVSEEPSGTTGGRLIYRASPGGPVGEIRFRIDSIAVEDSPSNPDGWQTVRGLVSFNGAPVCALVLANGQYIFTCGSGDDLGRYELTVPLDDNDEITIQVFVAGLAPFRTTIDPSNLNIDVNMQAISPESVSPQVTVENISDASTPQGWRRIAGSVTFDGQPLCALVLVNGQYMFSCGVSSGVYDLTVPLDGNGQITVFVFVSGLQPFQLTITL